MPKKLGIKEGMDVVVLGAPPYFSTTLGALPDGASLADTAGEAEIYIVFSDSADEIDRLFHLAMGNIPADGAIWVAWPKKSSGIETDLSEATMRDVFLPTGMVDNKVCAIDEIWSGLRFVVRKENRPTWRLAT
ncbi:MAG: DUF3052 domain-containing protein [Acidimicrobiia bacterium]|nr:DUF3052 domain-containing protein [Acidimicrobiia bacterium]